MKDVFAVCWKELFPFVINIIESEKNDFLKRISADLKFEFYTLTQVLREMCRVLVKK